MYKGGRSSTSRLVMLSLDPPVKWGCFGRVNVKGAL